MEHSEPPKRTSHFGVRRRSLLAAATVLAATVNRKAAAEDGEWLRDGDLGETPEHRTDTLPLSDQGNSGGWIVDQAFTDEFNGTSLDLARWYPTIPGWPGRQPAAFSVDNVRVADGKLLLGLRKEDPPANLQQHGYHGWTSAAVQSRRRVLYGYFEVRSKPMKSRAASTFWFSAKDPDQWTEIDVYEVWPGAPGNERAYSTNLHVFEMPSGKPDHTRPGLWTAPFDLADDYHVYGLEWGPKYLMFFVDGVLIRRAINTAWHQALALTLDVEIMAAFRGIPDAGDDYIPYSIDYVRGFKKQP